MGARILVEEEVGRGGGGRVGGVDCADVEEDGRVGGGLVGGPILRREAGERVRRKGRDCGLFWSSGSVLIGVDGILVLGRCCIVSACGANPCQLMLPVASGISVLISFISAL